MTTTTATIIATATAVAATIAAATAAAAAAIAIATTNTIYYQYSQSTPPCFQTQIPLASGNFSSSRASSRNAAKPSVPMTPCRHRVAPGGTGQHQEMEKVDQRFSLQDMLGLGQNMSEHMMGMGWNLQISSQVSNHSWLKMDN